MKNLGGGTNSKNDEAHCVLLWAMSGFKESLLDVKNLRSHVSEALMIGLTATASAKDIKDLKQLLGMRSDTVVIQESPDR